MLKKIIKKKKKKEYKIFAPVDVSKMLKKISPPINTGQMLKKNSYKKSLPCRYQQRYQQQQQQIPAPVNISWMLEKNNKESPHLSISAISARCSTKK